MKKGKLHKENDKWYIRYVGPSHDTPELEVVHFHPVHPIAYFKLDKNEEKFKNVEVYFSDDGHISIPLKFDKYETQ